MLKPFFVASLLALSAAAAAKSRTDNFTTQRRDSIIGYNINKVPLHAACYSLPAEIFRIGIDNEQNNAVLLLRNVDENNRFYGDGELSLLNFEAGNFDWHFGVKGTEVHRTRNTIFYQSKAGTSIFNVADKKRLPASLNNFCFLGYHNDIAYDGVNAVDLKTGKQIWKHSIRNSDVPFDGLRQINDSMVAFSWAGMHVLNIKTGEGWDYKMKTTKGMGVAIAASIGIGAATGLLTPVAVVPAVRFQTGMKSNIVFDNQNIYFADKESIVCWNINTGAVLWENELPSKKTSSSELFIAGENIYLVNKGHLGNKEMGQPFIAAYNKQTGAKLFFEELGESGISSVLVQGDTCLLYNGSVCKVDLNTGKHLSLKITGGTETKWLIDPEEFFIERGASEMVSLKRQFPGSFAVQDANGAIIMYGNNNDVKARLRPDAYWTLDRRYNDSRILYHINHTLAVERNGQKIATLEPAIMDQFLGDKLYRVVDRGLQVISLPEVLAN
ncbi:outer membrane protein assembly factor BamB family protein [Taibaiella soli]|nr:PQQ-binding-like beta-propeller repeat protein [Taibaiella soli]